MDKMKSTQGVMIHVLDDVNKFIESDKGSMFMNQYKQTFDSIKERVLKLARIEETILQQKCMDEKNFNIKLSILRDYVYARTPFYRMDKATKDIRVIVSRLDLVYPDHIPTIDELSKDSTFMEIAKQKLATAMCDEYMKTREKYWEDFD